MSWVRMAREAREGHGCLRIVLGAGEAGEVGEERDFVGLGGVGGEEEVEVGVEASKCGRLGVRERAAVARGASGGL